MTGGADCCFTEAGGGDSSLGSHTSGLHVANTAARAEGKKKRAAGVTRSNTMSLVENAVVLMAGQVVSKAFTFSLNQVLLSHTSAQALGITQVAEFALDYALFVSREALRLSIAKLPKGREREQWTVNLSCFSVAIFTLLGLPMVYWKIGLNGDPAVASALEPFTASHLTLAVSTCITLELLAEPYYNLNQYVRMDFKTRTKIESVAGLCRCIAQFVAVVGVAPHLGMASSGANSYIFGYVVGQLAYSSTVAALYWRTFSFKIHSPRMVSGSWVQKDCWTYFKSIFVQQIFKNFLTVGDRLVITSLLSVETQGYFSFISNYGSLLARMLFAPVEESTRITIGALFKNEYERETQARDFADFSACLANVCKVYVHLLTLLLVFAPLNTEFLLNMAFKNFVSHEVVVAFKLYWLYVVVLAVNGVLEALFQSLFQSKEHVNRYSTFMLANSVTFLATLVLLIREWHYSLNGLILANMANMLLRICYCAFSISGFIRDKEHSLHMSFNLNLSQYTAFLGSAAVVALFQYVYFDGDVTTWRQFAISAFCGCSLVSFALYSELSRRLQRKKKD